MERIRQLTSLFRGWNTDCIPFPLFINLLYCVRKLCTSLLYMQLAWKRFFFFCLPNTILSSNLNVKYLVSPSSLVFVRGSASYMWVNTAYILKCYSINNFHLGAVLLILLVLKKLFCTHKFLIWKICKWSHHGKQEFLLCNE